MCVIACVHCILDGPGVLFLLYHISLPARQLRDTFSVTRGWNQKFKCIDDALSLKSLLSSRVLWVGGPFCSDSRRAARPAVLEAVMMLASMRAERALSLVEIHTFALLRDLRLKQSKLHYY
jgi:hypothetical protein